MTKQERSDHGSGFEARKAHFIVKTQEFLERLRSREFPGREDYENEIKHHLQELRRSQTKAEAERIVNAICLKVAIACYALKAQERVGRDEKPGGSDR